MGMPADNTGMVRMTHHQGVRTVQVAARGAMLQDASAFTFIARLDKDGKSQTQVDARNGDAFASFLVETSEVIRMATALAALLTPRTSNDELAARALAFASGRMVERGWHVGGHGITPRATQAEIADAYRAGYEAGRREG